LRKSGLLCCVVLCALLEAQVGCYAQGILYTAKVVDFETNVPLPYVNVIVQGKRVGTFSNDTGAFKIQCDLEDSLVLSHIGYEHMKVAIDTDQRLIRLMQQPKLLNEVIIASSRRVRTEKLGLVDQKGDVLMGGVFQYAVYIENKSKQTGVVKTLHFKVGHAFNREKTEKLPAKIRARVYEREPLTGRPGRDILRTELIFTIQPNQNHLKIDLSNENVPFLADGVFIGLDVLGYIDDTGALVHYHINDAKKHLHIPVTIKFGSPLTYMNPDGQEWRIHKTFDSKTGRREIANACFSADVQF
jgi:hypothetical protein